MSKQIKGRVTVDLTVADDIRPGEKIDQDYLDLQNLACQDVIEHLFRREFFGIESLTVESQHWTEDKEEAVA